MSENLFIRSCNNTKAETQFKLFSLRRICLFFIKSFHVLCGIYVQDKFWKASKVLSSKTSVGLKSLLRGIDRIAYLLF